MNSQILQQNYFEIFSQEQKFNIDQTQLQSRLLELQKQFHPDNFVGTDPGLTTKAIQISSHINHAYNILKEPLNRAIYLLELQGIKVDLVHETKFSHEFLIEQIELREKLDEAQEAMDIDCLEEIENGIKNSIQQLINEINLSFTNNDYSNLVELIKKLAFYTKLEQTVSNIIAQL